MTYFLLSTTLLLLASTANAFTANPNVAFVPSHTTRSTIHGGIQQHRSIIVLNASKNKQKIASRTKWVEERGFGQLDAASDGDSEGSGEGSGPKLIIAGAPASGKGTQCELIKEKYGVVHLSTGDMLRAAVAAGTDVGKQAKDFMDAGKLVPDEVIIGVVSLCENVYVYIDFTFLIAQLKHHVPCVCVISNIIPKICIARSKIDLMNLTV